MPNRTDNGDVRLHLTDLYSFPRCRGGSDVEILGCGYNVASLVSARVGPSLISCEPWNRDRHEVGATFTGSGIMRRPQVGELIKQIAVGPYFVPRHLPVCEDSQEGIGGIVGECPAIGWEGRRASGVIGQHVRQQCSRHTPCFRRRIPTRVFQRVCEDGDETGIVYRLTREVGISLPADKEDGLRGQRAAIRLDPTPARADKRAGP